MIEWLKDYGGIPFYVGLVLTLLVWGTVPALCWIAGWFIFGDLVVRFKL